MVEKFRNIDIHNEKVERIINAAFEEFGKYGEKKATLNNILKSASLSKGVFYHYFKNKEDLHEFLIYFSVKANYELLDNESIWSETDFINRMIKSVSIKYEFMRKYPYVFEFFDSKAKNQLKLYTQKIDIRETDLRKRFHQENLDFSNVKPNININKLINLVNYVIKQIVNDYIKKAQVYGKDVDMEVMMQEIEEYAEFIRIGYYK